jgi:hypothetical protein
MFREVALLLISSSPWAFVSASAGHHTGQGTPGDMLCCYSGNAASRLKGLCQPEPEVNLPADRPTYPGCLAMLLMRIRSSRFLARAPKNMSGQIW